ncbi:MAG: hypothetical protein IJK86_03345 [Lachnospiraceae bacterium]|nr:hypothetical protein [Lachnospiraceae bacterium]
MLGIYIKTIRDFSRLLFLEPVFDDFLLAEGRFVTSFTTDFDGSATAEDVDPYIRWEQVRPLAFQLIKGKVPPKSFSLALVYPSGKTKALLAQGGEPADEDALPLLFLNIRYREEKLMLTTGVSEKTFRPHSGAVALWDRQVRRMLEELGLGDAISEP